MRMLLHLLACVMPAAAMALSCQPVDVARAYRLADQAEARYVIVHGTFDFAQEALVFSEPALNGEGILPAPAEDRSRSATARFQGTVFTGAAGFDRRGAFDVELYATCLGPWCGGGSLAPGQPVLAFLEETDAGPRLTLGPCGGWVFRRPTADTLAQVEACHAGRDCAAGPRGEEY